MAEYTADPGCLECQGSGIEDPSWWLPCVCILRQYPDDEITGYPDHYIVNGDHSGCFCREVNPDG